MKLLLLQELKRKIRYKEMSRKESKAFKKSLHRDVDTRKVINKIMQKRINNMYDEIYKGTKYTGRYINVQR